ncbi:LIPS lipase, partial [Picathartes gymnocephalus]|nr:LIPS lipase [Picathartes gymnocephalus]
AALGQLRALLVLAGKMAELSKPGCLFPDGEKVLKEENEEEEEEEEEEEGISEVVLREYSTMHNGCFYGRCLGFQVRGEAGGCLGIFGNFLGIFGMVGLVGFGSVGRFWL